MFNDENIFEQIVLDTVRSGILAGVVGEERARYAGERGGWRFIPTAQLPRQHSDVLVEPMVREAIRVNSEISADPDRADEVLYRLRAILSGEGRGPGAGQRAVRGLAAWREVHAFRGRGEAPRSGS